MKTIKMKEIDINIEGYNVNGICVGCLNYNRKMFYDNDVKECFKLIADIDVPDGLQIQVCWECMASVRNIVRFQEQILKSYDILLAYSQKHTFLNSPEDFTKHATTRLKTVSHENTDSSIIQVEVDVKSDVKEESLHDTELEPVKQEPYPEQYDDFDFDQEVIQKEESSDEDVQLSELKKKKTKKDKKKKVKNKDKINESKSSRKLKNLPESVVELITMTEEEMWQVRQKDVTSPEFEKLKFKCTDCILGFNTKKLKEAHFNGKHKKKNSSAQQCDVCKAYFLTSDKISTHRALHLTAYKCTVCLHITTLKRSMLRHHCAAVQYAEHRCNYCDMVFSTKSKLSYHKNVCHQERPQCDCCGKVFANKMTLKYHLKILPQNKEEKQTLYIPCKGCNKVFHSKKSYRAHVVIHDGRTYPCPICGKLFKWKRNLSRHTRAHRERSLGATHECRECMKTFSSRDCYNNHMKLSKRHNHPTNYIAVIGSHECRECMKTFSSRDCYNNHMKLSKRHNHPTNYLHECNYCGKKFPTKWCMVDHIDWDHLKRMKYQCSVCFKAFKTAKIMVAHVNNIHNGKKREQEGEHLCEICGKSYKTVKRLKGHVWAMHTQRSTAKSYKCKLCAATFTWQTSIYKHMKMMHDSKRTKAPRAPPVVRKQEPYPDMELTNRMYFHQNIAIGHIQPLPQDGLITGI